ncbi:MAG: virulence factor [Ignavibacteriaceae bacterium]
MAYYQILYWQDIPSQVKAWDDIDEAKIELSQEFMIKIDSAAKDQDLTKEDDYLNQWKWGEELELEGSPKEVVEAIKKELEAKFKG